MAEALTAGVGGNHRLQPRAASSTTHLTTLVVQNMHCGACIRNVETALLAVAGVTSARANLSQRRVSVGTREELASAAPLIAALERAGFTSSQLAAPHAALDESADRAYLRRLGVAGFAAANIMLLSVSVWAGAGSDMPQSLKTLFHWLSAAIALPAVAYAGQPFFSSARQALAARRLNMDVPISLGVGLATAMSLFQTFRGSEQVYFDAAISLLFFLLIGRYLDLVVRRRAAGVAQNLLGLQGSEATVIEADGRSSRLATARVTPGMRILVATGERVPVDARLLCPTATIDDSLITGESLPRPLRIGDQVYAGTINLGQALEAETTAAADNTLIAELARLIESAQQSKSRYVRLADRAARLYAPAVHVLGAGTFLGWILAGYGWEPSLTAAIAVLIITCPCALALAVPAVQVVATGRLLKRGIIVKAADGLERLAEIDTIVLDKTGTLTLPEPRLAAGSVATDDHLARAASLATASRHPYARAIVAAARQRAIPLVPATGVREVTGAGLEVDGVAGVTRLGSAAFCGAPAVDDDIATLWLSEPQQAPIAFRFQETVRSDAASTVAKLKQAGLQVELLSGDREGPVASAAHAAGIGSYRSAQKPDQKVAHLDALARQGRFVLMIGDGLNDAPALAAGHASLSPSTAADISQTAADAIFQGERLAPVIEVLAVARAARKRALENFAIAIGYNLVFVPMAVAGLVTPLIAAIAMSASSIAVTANAMRLGLSRTEDIL
jgi:Cu2+-exporting ATPase